MRKASKIVSVILSALTLLSVLTVGNLTASAADISKTTNCKIATAIEASDPPNISAGDYLTDEEAKCFIGFLYSTNNLSDEELSKNNMFNLLTGKLTGQEEEYAGLQFIEFMNARLSETSKKIGNLNDYSSQFLIDYLTNGVNEGAFGSDLASDIINSTLKNISGQFQDYIFKEYLISGHGLENMEYEFFTDGMLDAKYWKDLKSIPSKVEEYKKQVLALSNAIFYITSTNREEMYSYFLIYKNNLDIKYEIGDEAFDLVMSTNELLNEKFTFIKMIEPTLANWEFLDERLLLWTTEDRISLIERWAEYTYQLEKRIKENTVSFQNQNIEKGSNTVHYTVIAKDDLDYVLTADGAVITGFHGGYSYAKIPSSIDGYKVVKIAKGAFSNDPWLRYVYIPASIQSIEKNAFLNCYGLKKAIIPNGSTLFSERVFSAYRSQIINGIEYKLDKGLGVTLCGASNSNVELYANESGNLFESTDWDGKSVTEVYPVDNTYYINMVSELAWIAKQTNAGNDFSEKKVVVSGEINFNSKSWTPIGNSNNPFKGSIYILDCEIHNFIVRCSGSGYYSDVRAGLFGEAISSDVKISQVKVINAYVYGSGYQTVKTGILFGKLQMSQGGKFLFEDSELSGKVEGKSDENGATIGYLKIPANSTATFKELKILVDVGGNADYLESLTSGGIVGHITGSGNLNISNISLTGNILAYYGQGYYHGYSGGLIGQLSGSLNTRIELCSLRGEIDGSGYANSSFFGGFVGNAEFKRIQIENSYVQANVKGYWKGGFLGRCICSDYDNSYIRNCYLSGECGTSGGAFISFNSSDTKIFPIENCYFDLETTKQLNSKKVCSAGFLSENWIEENVETSFGYSTDEMKKQESYKLWDFENIWYLSDGEYPVLLNQVEEKERYKIKAEALSGGTISANGTTTAIKGSNITYKISSYETHNIDKLIVDGIEKHGVGEYTFSNVESNHTIVAVFKEKPRYNINYELNGGVSNEKAPNFVNEGLSVNLINPSKKGCIFDGWYDNPEFNGKRYKSISSSEAQEMTLYAKWNCEIMLYMGNIGITVSSEGGNPYQTVQEGTSIEDIVIIADTGRYIPENYIETIDYDKNSGLIIERIDSKKIMVKGILKNNVTIQINSEIDYVKSLFGDADCDGEVTLKDAIMAQKAALRLLILDEQSTATADMNGNGKITLFDAIAIQRLVLTGTNA